MPSLESLSEGGNEVLAKKAILRVPVAQWLPTRIVLLSGGALCMGITGDLASCGRGPLPPSWAAIFTSFHYVAIVLAAVGFGYRIGVTAAVVVGFAHVSAGAIGCGRSLRGGEAAAFIVVGLVAGIVTRFAKSRTKSRFAQIMTAPAEHDNGERSPKADVVGNGQIFPGFLEAIRNPLSAIESAVYVWEEAELAAENHREVAAIILKECHHLNVLAQSLEFVLPRTPAYREIKLSALLGEIIRLVRPVTEAASITLRKAESLDLRLICDPNLIEQAISNLITNAIRIVGQGDEMVLSAHAQRGGAIIELSHGRTGVLGQIRISIAATPEG